MALLSPGTMDFISYCAYRVAQLFSASAKIVASWVQRSGSTLQAIVDFSDSVAGAREHGNLGLGAFALGFFGPILATVDLVLDIIKFISLHPDPTKINDNDYYKNIYNIEWQKKLHNLIRSTAMFLLAWFIFSFEILIFLRFFESIFAHILHISLRPSFLDLCL